MFKQFFIIAFFTFSIGFSQNNQLWKGYFSFNQVTDISESPSSIVASSENAIFSKNITTNDIKTTTTVDGLKAVSISAIYYSQNSKITFVGNSNGLLLLILPDGTFIQKIGIISDVPVPANIKKINHFLENDGKIYVSCDYGISIFDLTTLEFGNTYYMGPQGSYVSVQQTTISNGFIYAATKGNASGSGIRKANLSNQFLDDYNQWVDTSGSEWNGVTSFGTNILAITTGANVYKYNGSNWINFSSYPENLLHIRATSDYAIVTSPNNVYIYNQGLQLVTHLQSSQITATPVTFTCATVINDVIYIGTNENGILTSSISNPTSFGFIIPNGPIRNRIFRVKKSSTALWALYGAYDQYYNPYNPNNAPYGLFQYPISKYTNDNGWTFIPYSNLFGAKSLSNIAFNPNNDNQFYVSSYFSGLLKVVNDVPTVLYNSTNTGANGLESLQLSPPNPTYIDIRVNGPVFDKNGDLWMTNNYLVKPLKVLRTNGQWQSYDFTSAESASDLKDTSYGIPVVDKNGTKWLSQDRNGVVAFNENYNNKFITIKTGSSGDLPNGDVRCLAVDNKNQLWIGTIAGLRIVPSVDSFITETDIQSKAIIILENDLAQELFYSQFIIDIAVDGANRKWVSIADSGVYLVTSDGQQTVYHFTKDNSPLPTNNVNDIEIDGVTGEVFFATDKGMVSFKGTSTRASNDLSSVYVYPNPVRPEFEGTVKISDLTDKATVKITDIEGNLVFETTSQGGTIEWDTTAFGKYKVSSGVYVIFVSAQDGSDTTVRKVMIIR